MVRGGGSHQKSLSAQGSGGMVSKGTEEGNGRRRNEPSQAEAGGGNLNRSETAGFNKVDAYGVGVDEAAAFGAIEIGHWFWQT